MTSDEVRASISQVLHTLDADIEAAIRTELARPIDLGHSQRLQFEACPQYFGARLVQTEEDVLPDSAVQNALPQAVQDAADEADLYVCGEIEKVLPAWFADRWEAAGGPARFRPAYLFFHGGPSQPRFDSEGRRWCAVSEVWPGEA